MYIPGRRARWISTESIAIAPVIAASVAAAGWTGIALPQQNISGHRVHPDVTPDVQVWQRRVAAGQGPELDPSTLAIWESWTPDLGPMPPATPLSIVGVVSAARPGRARAAVSWLAGLGAGLVVVTSTRPPPQQTIWECDYENVHLVWTPPGRPPLRIVAGMGRPGIDRTPDRPDPDRARAALRLGVAHYGLAGVTPPRWESFRKSGPVRVGGLMPRRRRTQWHTGNHAERSGGIQH